LLLLPLLLLPLLPLPLLFALLFALLLPTLFAFVFEGSAAACPCPFNTWNRFVFVLTVSLLRIP
jgi:hypothetical protein